MLQPFTTLGAYMIARHSSRLSSYNLPAALVGEEVRPRGFEERRLNLFRSDDIMAATPARRRSIKNGELVGLILTEIFIAGGRLIYDESVTAAISVDVRAIAKFCARVFDANEIVDELNEVGCGTGAVARP